MDIENNFAFKYILLLVLLHVSFEVTHGIAIGPTANVTLCGNLTCLHNAKCRNNSHGDPYCMCQTGYTGDTCIDDVDECNLGNPCMHRGVCVNSIGSYRCQCLHGWFGVNSHCDVKDNSTTYRNCTPGWIGEWCQDQCLNNFMCRPTEECIKRGRGLHCICASGWIGRNCSVDKDECTQSPCPKNAFCTNTPGSYQCNCYSGMTGTNCDTDIDECLRNPCRHSSTCVNERGYFNCTCREGWRGHTCEKDVNECENNPCNSSYVCENNPGSFLCSLKKPNTTGKDKTKIYIIIGAVLGSFLMVCSIATWLGIIKYRCSRKVGHDKRKLIKVEERVPEKTKDVEHGKEELWNTKQKPTQQTFINKKWIH